VGILHVAYLLTCWSSSPMQVWSPCLAAQEPSCFLSVTWRGETLSGLGVQGVGGLILLGGFFLPSVAPASQQNFWFTELTLLPSSHHLGSSLVQFCYIRSYILHIVKFT
jgi:hypothetical protein